jgi:hypothetical protein
MALHIVEVNDIGPHRIPPTKSYAGLVRGVYISAVVEASVQPWSDMGSNIAVPFTILVLGSTPIRKSVTIQPYSPPPDLPQGLPI